MRSKAVSKAVLARRLAVAKAQIAAFRSIVALIGTGPSRAASSPTRFVQCWPVTRGYSAVTQALDAEGHVWERVSRLETVGGKKTLAESWWEPLDMRRRTPTDATAPPTPPVEAQRMSEDGP